MSDLGPFRSSPSSSSSHQCSFPAFNGRIVWELAQTINSWRKHIYSGIICYVVCNVLGFPLDDELKVTELMAMPGKEMQSLNKSLLAVYDGAQHCTPSDFNDHAFKELKKLVHFDSAVVANFIVMPEAKIVIQSLHLHCVNAERFHDRPKIVGTEKLDRNGTLNSGDAVLSNAFAHRGNSVIVDIAEQFSDPDMLKYCRKYETAHSLTYVSRQTPDGQVPIIGLWRAGRRNAYRPQHGDAVTMVMPHIFQAMEINRRLAVAPAPLGHKSTTALASLDGYLYFVESEAIRLLQLEWKEWSPPLLPRVFIDSLRRNKEEVFAGEAISMRASVQGNMICLVITARANQHMGLTAAEYRVARLAADGLRYKDIARQLDLSPATVRNQLHTVYGKLGVSNKTALAAVISRLAG